MQSMKECLRCRSWFGDDFDSCPYCHSQVARRLTDEEEAQYQGLKQLIAAMVTAWRKNDHETVIDLAVEQCNTSNGTLELICMLIETIRYMESIVGNILDVDEQTIHEQFAMKIGTGEI